MKLKCSRECLKYAIVLLPFFEPYSISMMSESSSAWAIIGILFTAGRYLVSLYFIASFLIKKKESFSLVGVLSLAFSVIRIISSIINGTIYFTFFISLFTYIGFVLVCERLISQRKDGLVFDVILLLFGMFSLFGIIAIFLFPNGFNYAISKAEALYFLGSKNSSFYYFFMFLIAWVLRAIFSAKINTNKNTFFTVTFFVLSLVGAFICDSSNTVGTLLALFLIYFVVRFSHFLYRLSNPYILLCVVSLITILLLIKDSIPFFNLFFSLLGRSGTMTGRDYIWSQQLLLIRNSPVWGNGIIVETILKSNAIATHAHNFYLDTVVKYGFVALISLIVLLLASVKNITKIKKTKYKSFLAGSIFCLLLHSIFDDVSLYLLFMVLMLTEYKIDINKA